MNPWAHDQPLETLHTIFYQTVGLGGPSWKSIIFACCPLEVPAVCSPQRRCLIFVDWREQREKGGKDQCPLLESILLPSLQGGRQHGPGLQPGIEKCCWAEGYRWGWKERQTSPSNPCVNSWAVPSPRHEEPR